jgi:uncharacterized membrane protein YqhA
MKCNYLLTGLLSSALMVLPVLSFSQSFDWAKALGGADYDEGSSIALDASGNVYTTGYFNGTADFDPGAGVFNLTSSVSSNVFISKLDALGNFVWAKAIGGSIANGIVLDASGNIYTTGNFQGIADFDPGVGLFNLTSAGQGDVFISKLDSSGNFVWAKAIGGTGFETGNSIALDASGNVITTGYFDGTADFDPGAGQFNITSSGNKDIFVSKLNSTGNFVLAKTMGGTGSDRSWGIALDSSANVLIIGDFESTADFDPGAGLFNLVSLGINDIFIAKLDAAGNFLWAKAMGGTNSDIGYSVKIDASNNVYTTGAFNLTVDFDPGAAVFNLTSAGGNDIFISKFDASGNFIWAKAMGGTMNDNSFSLALDASANLYTAGFFRTTADFDPGAGLFNLTVVGAFDIFISKLDASGNFAWAKGIGGIETDIARCIALDNSNNIYTTGVFRQTVDFDPDAGVFNLTSAGFSEVFVQKTSQTPVLSAEEITDNTDFTIYPNPNDGIFSLNIDKEITNGKLILLNAIGQIVHEQKIVQGTNEIITNELAIGLYTYVLFRDNQLVSQGRVVIK